MNGLLLIVGAIIVVFSSVTGNRRSGARHIVLPPIPLGPDTPICTSYSSLCNLAYNITETHTNQIYESDQQLCRCLDNHHCETGWLQTRNSIIKEIKNHGQDMQVKMDYCRISQPRRVCRKNELAIVMRGRGALLFEVVSDFRCRCYRSLFPHESWTDGAYHYIQYSCGKPRCPRRHGNLVNRPACTTVSYESGGLLRHNYNCRCLRHQECTTFRFNEMDQLSHGNPVLNLTCQDLPVPRHRQHRRSGE